jgi:hypothetical protein
MFVVRTDLTRGREVTEKLSLSANSIVSCGVFQSYRKGSPFDKNRIYGDEVLTAMLNWGRRVLIMAWRRGSVLCL